MNLYPARRNPDRCPTHPGAVLAEAIEATGKSKAEIARLLGVSRQYLYDIMNEQRPISLQMAARIGKLLGNGPRLWLNMQAAYDTWHAEREVDVSQIPTLHAA